MDRKAMLLSSIRRLLQPGEVCLGKGCLCRLAALGGGRALVVAARSAERTGTSTSVVTHLEKASVATAVWSGESLEPTPDRVRQISQVAGEHQPDWIIAVGGGAIIDAAKLAWAHYENPTLDLDGERPSALGPLRSKARFIAIPTTAGAGSEASQVAVLTDAKLGKKIPWVSSHLVPDIAILDPVLTASLPPELTACAGMDALAHAVEAYVSRLATPMVRMLAAAAIRTVLRHLPRVVQNPEDLDARQAMLDAAYVAGTCQSASSTGLAHAISHAAASVLKAPHAHCLALLLLPTMRFNAEHGAAELYRQLAFDAGYSAAGDLIEAINEMLGSLPVPRTLTDLIGGGVREPDWVKKLSAAAIVDVCHRTNPVRATEADVQTIVETLQ